MFKDNDKQPKLSYDHKKTKDLSGLRRYVCSSFQSELWCYTSSWCHTSAGASWCIILEQFAGNQKKAEYVLDKRGSYGYPIMIVDRDNIWLTSTREKTLWQIDKIKVKPEAVFNGENAISNLLDDDKYIWLSDDFRLYKFNKENRQNEIFTLDDVFKQIATKIGKEIPKYVYTATILRKVTPKSVWVEVWSGEGCLGWDYPRDFVGLARLDKNSLKWDVYVLNKDFLNKNALDSVFYLPFDIDDEDFLWVAKSVATWKKICLYEGCAYNFSANIFSLMRFDTGHAVNEYSVETLITSWVGLFAKDSHGSQGSWFSMKAGKDVVWIVTMKAIIKFDKKNHKWFYKSLVD